MRNLYRFIFIWSFSILLSVFLSYISFAQSPSTIKIVAQGDPTPVGGTFGTPISSDFNDNEAILFVSEIAPFKYASFVASGEEITNVITDSQSVEGLGMITRSNAASINNNGSIAFSAQIVNGDTRRDGLFLRTAEGIISPLVFNEDPIEGGTIGTPSLRPYSINNNGAVAFAGYITPEPFRQAIFISSGGSVSKVVATGESTPLGGTYKFGFMNIMDFNDAGTVLFGADIEGGSSPEGIFTASGGVITKIVARGDPSLDGKQFTYLDPAAMNNLGDIIFEASVGVGFESEYDGLFLYSGGAISLITRTGDQAPGGGTIGTFSLPEINDSKQIVFEASIDGGPSGYGIFIFSDGVIGKVVTNGETTPIGGNFSSAANPKLNAGGSVVFNGVIEGGSAASGIFLWNGGPKLEVSRDTVEFTDIVPGQTARLDMELSNTGSRPLEVQEITASPSPPFGLENAPSVPFSIEPGQKAQFLVTYSSPSNNSTILEKISEALQDGSLTIKTNAPNSPTVIPIKTPATLHMIPNGVAYDPLNPYLEGGGAFHSKFTRLKVSGSNLELVNQVIFEPSEHIEVTRINATSFAVDFDMIVYHDAVLGERDLFLRTSDGKEINVTQTTGKKFIISKIATQFNQAVDQAAVNTLEYRDKLVANKQGVIRVQFQDPNQYGHRFNGRVEVSGFGIISASAGSELVHQESYSEAEIINGKDYLTMPIQHPLTAGKKEFKVLFNRISDGRSIDGPIINREIIESLELNILAYSFRIRKGDGTILNPVSDANVNSALDHLKLVYPVSETKVNFRHIKTRDLPSRYETKDATLTDGTSVTILTKKGKDDLFAALSKKLEVENKKLLAENKPLYTLLVTFLPDHILDVDNDNDGKVDGQILGSTSAGFKVCVIGLQNPLNIRSTLSHEIGHAIGTSLHPNPEFEDIDKYNNLGDEYEGGNFHCEVNPPVKGLSGFENSSCVNSPFLKDIHGDNIGTFSDMSAFNPVTMRPMLTYKGTAQTVINYNFMSAGIGTERTWVQPSTYGQLFTSLIPITGNLGNVIIAENAASNAIQLRGIIYNNDAVTFDDFNILFTDSRTYQLGGQYMFELQDASGNVIASHSFDLDFIEISEPPRKSESDFFNITMDYPEGTKNIVLKKNGVQIASRIVSNNAPVVQITSHQSSGNFSGEVNISWTASDPDGDPLRYTILYAPDNETWLPIETNLTETSYTWDSNQFPGGISAKLAVIASDGINSGEAETTAGFSIDKKLPSVEFTLPLTDTTYDGISPIVFAASGYDPEDGTLDPTSYAFTSSIDGQLGTGSPFYVNNLSAGQHTIIVSVQDSDGNIAADSVSIIAQIPLSVKDKETALVPDEYKLYQNYPNPFNPSTNIQFDLPEASHVSIIIYDIQGQEIITLIDRMYSAGRFNVIWNGAGYGRSTLSSGVYFIQMRAGDFMIVKKAVLLR